MIVMGLVNPGHGRRMSVSSGVMLRALAAYVAAQQMCIKLFAGCQQDMPSTVVDLQLMLSKLHQAGVRA